MKGIRGSSGLAALFVVAASLVAAPPAGASFHGANGRIAFSQGDIFPPIGGEPGDLGAHSQVYTMSPKGKHRRQLTHVKGNQAASSPEFSPNGNKIVYQSNQSGASRIWVMNANGSNKTRLTGDEGFEEFQPSWSHNGNRIVFSHCGEPFGFLADCDIARIKANGDDLTTLLSSGHWFNIHPSYSPDGEKIVFSSDRGGLQSAIWVMNADGSSLKRLTPPILRAFWADWAPNGKRIVFGDNCCVFGSNLWTVHAQGGGLRQLTHSETDVGVPSYSPNGKRILDLRFGKRGATLESRRAGGGHPHRIPSHKSNVFLSDWGAR